MKSIRIYTLAVLLLLLAGTAWAFSLWGNNAKTLTPANGVLQIPLADISDGAAHHFRITAGDGTDVTFFTLKSRDGIIRAAIDSCDVCYRSGKGYHQEGDFMVCENCGQKFASNKINVIKGGCNPAPLKRAISNDSLVIAMADIDANSWYCKFKR